MALLLIGTLLLLLIGILLVWYHIKKSNWLIFLLGGLFFVVGLSLPVILSDQEINTCFEALAESHCGDRGGEFSSFTYLSHPYKFNCNIDYELREFVFLKREIEYCKNLGDVDK